MAERLSRHAILFHAFCRRHVRPMVETLVHDHFETFVGRQDFALGVGTAVGYASRFIYDVDAAPHRGSGRRPPAHILDPDSARFAGRGAGLQRRRPMGLSNGAQRS